MTDVIRKWDKLPEVAELTEVVKQPPTEEAGEEEQKQLMNTGITFQHERLLLETDSQEKLDAFKAAYHRLERHYLGDYGE